MSRPIPLGNFVLEEPLGRGGMATVWRARHRTQGVPVAVKVITGAFAQDPMFLEAFESEVRSVARLHHPGIVMVLDHGRADAEATEASKGWVAADAPYLVMELATGGSFDRLERALTWPELSQLLRTLLDALAHAHARGVLHRDLKPGNLLVSGPKDHRGGLKLTDFGIAHALERDGPPRAHEITGGTPAFMAPEQFEHAWRDYGPWTDLYAVGCIAHLYATGRVPFPGETPLQLAVAHLKHPPPRLVPVHPMPGDLEAWILRLLQKRPNDRYQRAADAAFALAELAPAASSRRAIPQEPIEDASTWSNARPEEIVTESVQVEWTVALPFNDETEEHPHKDLLTYFDEESAPALPDTPPPFPDEPPHPLPRVVPPLPPAWRRPSLRGPPLSLVGVGLGLFGLRPIPMVGRERERDVIWGALARVREERSARAVLLQGTAGTGKTRLAQWMAQRAAEVGNAIVWRASASLDADPLRRMVSRALRLEDLARDVCLERCRALLEHRGLVGNDDAQALTELVQPTPANLAPPGRVRLLKGNERYTLVRRLLEQEAKERPVWVVLDDVHLSTELILFAHTLLEAQTRSPSPILLLLTAREEALAERPQEASLLHHLIGSDRTDRLAISPLNPDDHLRLVDGLLRLERSLAHQVARRTAGNPSFLVELVADWVHRGALELGQDGFRLAQGESGILPDGVHEVWAERLSILLAGQPETANLGLEIGAALGRTVSQVEWSATCTLAGVPFPEGLVDLLVQERLLQPTSRGWSWVHGMLQETVQRLAKEAGRWPRIHSLAAETLLERYGLFTKGMAERIGNHYAAAGLHKEALTPLLRGAEERLAASEYLEAQALLRSYERSLSALGAPKADARWCECWLRRAQIAREQGSYKDAATLAERAALGASRWDLSPILAAAKLEVGRVAHFEGDPVRAMAAFHEAQVLYEAERDELGQAQCHLGIAEVRYRVGNLAGAADRYHDALGIFERLGAPEQSRCWWGLGYIALWRGQRAMAIECFEHQRRLAEQAGNRHDLARAMTGLAEVERLYGDLTAAEVGYQAALEIYEAIGAQEALTSHLNLASVHLAAGRNGEARHLLETFRASLGGRLEGATTFHVECAQLPTAAALDNSAEWDQLFEGILRYLDTTRLAEGDVPWTLELAARQAADRGWGPRAQAAQALAARLWRILGAEDRARRLEESTAESQATEQ